MTTDCHSGFQQEYIIHPEDVECESCHKGNMASHGEDGKKMQLSEAMCSECHETVRKNYMSPHPPVATGSCYVCHNPHGNIEKLLLPETYSGELYINYSEDEYKLCFSCHKRELLMFPDTSFSTDFRDGIKNLHYLHVTQSNRGRNCNVCHAVHGSDQPKMIVNKSTFGEWEMELNFRKNTMGGSCAPGCHRLQSYTRNR